MCRRTSEAKTLGIPTVRAILNRLVDDLPNVFVAILVLVLGTEAATCVAERVRGAMATGCIGNPTIVASIARGTSIGLAARVALEQLQIAPAPIKRLSTAMVGAVAFAFGLAFGLGGRERAQCGSRARKRL